MSILNKHITKKIRFEKNDLIIYNPTNEQMVEIRKILEENINVDEELNAKGELNLNSIRYLLKTITSISDEVDELTDETLIDILNNGDRDLKAFIRELTNLIEEIVEDIQYEQYEQIKTMNAMIKIMNMNLDTQQTEEKFNKLFKKKGLDLTMEDLRNKDIDPELLKSKMKPRNKTNK